MKHSILLLLTLLIIPCSYGQWTKLYPNTQEDLNAIHFTDENHGYICGTNGYVGKTTNGGVSWTNISINKQFELFDIFFHDSLNGYVVGMNSLIYQTNNGGIDWNNSVPISLDTDLKSIAFQNENFGVVVGEAGKLFVYENGIWTKQSYEQRLNFNDVTITDFGLAIIAADSGQVFLRPKDSIRFHEALNFNKISPLLAVEYIEGSIYAAGGWYDKEIEGFHNIFLESLDSGRSFQELESLEFDLISTMHFSSKNEGYYLGKATGFYTTDDKLFRTHRLSPGTNNSINNFFFLNENIVFTCGVVGTITKSVHGPGWTSGFEEIKENAYYYPNPAKDILHVSKNVKVTEVKVYDMQGKMLLAQANTNKIDISSLICGLYIVHSTSSNGKIKVGKIQVQ